MSLPLPLPLPMPMPNFIYRLNVYLIRIYIYLFFRLVTTLKDCWKKLRNCHRDALRRKKHQNEEKKSVKKWKHEDRMAFLLEFMAGCKEFPSSSASTRKEGTTSTIKSEPEEQFYLELSDLSTSPIPYKRSKTFEGVATTEPSAEIYPLGQENRPIPKWELSADKDEVDSFFESMCLTTKKLPKKYQLRIKKKLFDAVNEAEEEAANEDLLSVRVVNVGSEYR